MATVDTFMSNVWENHTCADACAKWDEEADRCVDQQCFMELHSHGGDKCNCTLLSQQAHAHVPHPRRTVARQQISHSQAVTTVGLVLLFVLLGVVLLVGWRCQSQPACCAPEPLPLSEASQNLINAHGAPGQRACERSTFLSVDSAISCTVCMCYAIDCILMPCAHEVACSRCAQALRELN